MTWQSASQYSGGRDPRMSPPPQADGSSPRQGPPETGASAAPIPHSHLPGQHHEAQPTPPLHQYRTYHHHHHHRPTYGHPLHSSPPPPRARQYDRYYDYHRSSYPPPPPHAPYAPPHHYGESSPDIRSSPMRELQGSPAALDLFRTGGCTCKKSRCLKLYCQCFALSSTCGPKCKCQTCHNTTLHAEAIEEARKTILERNPSAFDDKFRSNPGNPSPYRAPPPPPSGYHSSPPSSAWPPSAYNTPSAPSPRLVASLQGPPPPPPRVNKFGCKCRRSFCLKKYCECYQNSVHCGLNCRCTNCKNYPTDQNGPPPEAPPPAVPVSLTTSSPRCISDDGMAALSPEVKEEEELKAESQDRMAIMAAVAMTELFGKKKMSRRVSIGMDNKSDITPRKEVSKPKVESPLSAATPTTSIATPEIKRKAIEVSVVSSPEKSDDDSTPPSKRTRTGSDASSPIRAPVAGSRNPSPVSLMTPQHSYPRQHYVHRPPPPPAHHHGQHHPQHLPQPHHHHHAPPPAPHHSHYSPHRPYPSYYASPPHARASPTSYEDVIKSSGLPKALSFRKICSKCGKTRGEHGELGFGNKCVFQECGKCGGGLHVHTKVKSPMGILCRLTVEQGATPGAATGYERKIRDLAARAELQKTLLEDKRVRVERLAAQFVTTN